MGHNYGAVGWNRQKKVYDTVVASGVVLYVATFVGINLTLSDPPTIETLLIRAFATAALLLLHVVLCIGPLARLDSRFLPLLYNRRHLGVMTFLLGLAHGVFAIVQFHVPGNVNPFVSVLVSNTRLDSLSQFPFQPLGVAALAILFLMAATSHDFWLANLTAPVWKALHMMVYVAYALLIAHVTLGVLQAETNPFLTIIMGIGLVVVLTLHILAATKERAVDQMALAAGGEGFVDVCAVGDIPEKRARVANVGGERVAVFRYDGKISCVSNVCQHQNGPLGEGKIVDGYITCPWHGYQYCPDTGASPEPFTERIPTFQVTVRNGRVLVDPQPNPPGTPVRPATFDSDHASQLGESP